MGKAGSLQWAVFQTEGWGDSLNCCYFPGTQGLHTQTRARVHTHTYTYTHTHAYIHTHTNIHTNTHIHTHVHTYIHTHTHTHTRVHTHAHMRVHRWQQTTRKSCFFKASCRNSQVVQWLGISLPMQRTWVWPLVQGDPSCYRASEPMLHRKSQHDEKPVHHSEEKPVLAAARESPHSNEDPAQPK